MKKLAAASIAALLVFGSAQTALAEVIYYNLSKQGNLNITDSDDEYVVTSDGETSNVITVSDGVKTYIVLQGVTIKTTDENGISIGKNANVVLELNGDNSITVNTESYDEAKAGINVAEGDLTIKGGDTDSLTVKTVDSAGFAGSAGIGSDKNQNFSGTIIIEGGNITAKSGEDGAGIGSGNSGDMTGSITISGGTVKAKSGDDGAGIGSGYRGDMTGSITISGGTVKAKSGDDGAGIGSGEDSDMSGSVTISGGTVKAVSEDDGAGIGTGNDGEFTANIVITGGDILAKSKSDGAGIGSGDDIDMDGSIVISGGNISVKSNDGTGIGSSDDGYVTENGTIHIGGNANVNITSKDSPGIGSATLEQMNGSIIITDDASVDITLNDIYVKSGIGATGKDDYDPTYGAQFNGSISILEHASVNMKYDDPYYPDINDIPGIGIEGGSETGSITLSTGASINGISGADIEKLKKMGILDGVTKTESVEPTPEPVEPVEPEKPARESYSLTPLNLKQRIDKAQPGETVSVSESQLSKGKLPSYILEALALKEDVTLAIFCEEFCILIPSDEAVADAGSKQFYTIDELVKMYE